MPLNPPTYCTSHCSHSTSEEHSIQQNKAIHFKLSITKMTADKHSRQPQAGLSGTDGEGTRGCHQPHNQPRPPRSPRPINYAPVQPRPLPPRPAPPPPTNHAPPGPGAGREQPQPPPSRRRTRNDTIVMAHICRGYSQGRCHGPPRPPLKPQPSPSPPLSPLLIPNVPLPPVVHVSPNPQKNVYEGSGYGGGCGFGEPNEREAPWGPSGPPPSTPPPPPPKQSCDCNEGHDRD